MKKILSAITCIAIIIGMAACFALGTGAAEKSDGLYVKGTKLYDADGNLLVLRGVNIAHTWYQGDTSSAISAVKRLGGNSVRIVLSDGYQYSKNDYNNVQGVIQTCVNNGLICVLEVHDHTGKDSLNDLNAAVNYWKEMKSLLNQYKKYVIVNIANEWLGTWDNWSTWESGYVSAVKNLRSAGIQNVIMVDAPGYGQETTGMFMGCRAVREADTTGNIMFSIHMYSVAGKNEETVKHNIDSALDLGCCLCIGEFGNQHQGANVDAASIMSYCTEKRVGYLGWSWKGNSGSDAALDISSDTSGYNLTNWGKLLFNNTYGIANTSKLAYSSNKWVDDLPDYVEPVTDTDDNDGNNVFLSGKFFIATKNTNGSGVVMDSVYESTLNQNVIQITVDDIKSYGGYYYIVPDRAATPTSSTTGLGFWYMTPKNQEVTYNLFLQSTDWTPASVVLAPSNGEWLYYYVPWSEMGNPTKITNMNIYMNADENYNKSGTLYVANFAATANSDATAPPINDDNSNNSTNSDNSQNSNNSNSSNNSQNSNNSSFEDGAYNVTVKANNSLYGTVSGGGKFNPGCKLTLEAKANTGYKFVNWTYIGQEISSETTFVLNTWAEDIVITANFEIDPDAQDGRMGDINEDGIIDIIDVVLLRSYIVGNNTFSFKQLKLADLNNDGDCDISDVVMLRSAIVNE